MVDSRQLLNLHLDAFLSFAPLLKENVEEWRKNLIEEAAEADTFGELLEAWLWLHPSLVQWPLHLKLWFGLSYHDMAQILNLGERDIAQMLRNYRMSAVAKDLRSESDSTGIGGQSCFMVEQQLSGWLDMELPDFGSLSGLDLHLQGCITCHERLLLYRRVQAEILNARNRFPSVKPEEWEETVRLYKERVRRRWKRLIIYIVAVLTLGGILAGFLWSGPEKMPNIYEIHEP